MSHLFSQQHTKETPAYVPAGRREAQVMAEQKAAQRAPRLLDAIKQYVGDAAPGGALNREWTPENVRTAAEVGSMEPGVVGSALSAGLAVDDVRKGNYGDAALNALGVLPFVPSMAGVVRKSPQFGKPYDVYAYHGSPTAGIDVLKVDAPAAASKGAGDEGAGVVWGTTRKKSSVEYSGGSTMDNQAPVSQFGGKPGTVYKLAEKLKNPYVVNDLGDTSPHGRMRIIEAARKAGHDGVIFRDVSRGEAANFDVAFFVDVTPVKTFKSK